MKKLSFTGNGKDVCKTMCKEQPKPKGEPKSKGREVKKQDK